MNWKSVSVAMIKTTDFILSNRWFDFSPTVSESLYSYFLSVTQRIWRERESKYFIVEERKTNDGTLLRLPVNENSQRKSFGWAVFFLFWRASYFSPKDGNGSHKTPVQAYARNHIYTFVCLFHHQRKFDKKWCESVLDVTRNRVVLRWFITNMIFSIVLVRILLAHQ